jgi:uncharacterized protein YxjI
MKTYLIHQIIEPFVNKYLVYESDETGQQGNLMAMAQQKRLAFKEKFTMYTDGTKSQVAFEMQARQVLDFGARYDIRDANGQVLGTVGKDFKSSLLRSTWLVFRPGEEEKPALIAQERSLPLAIIRRIWGFLPIVGDFPFFIKYHFDFTDQANNEVAATYEKTTTFRDYYRLTIKSGAAEELDPRVLISLGILMDAAQSR